MLLRYGSSSVITWLNNFSSSATDYREYHLTGPTSFRKTTNQVVLSKVHKSSCFVVNMWIKEKELEENSEYYIELLAKEIGKPKQEIAKDVQRTKYFQAHVAMDYGLADKIMNSGDFR
ncbi:unnamed protein product [Vicia faba]|uniref:ATP-dependent Clp protease proteolytic subunit n=1 Tax=Vicia faba TaxID=3906 RepID=A0AAV0YY16_VICFA|nr:unnamed protein product [Vicia faba]